MQKKPLAELTDEALLARIAKRDGDAFAQLVDRYEPLVYRTAWGYTKNTADAEDLCQTVFLHIFRAAPSFRGDASASTWVFRIAKNAALDVLRRRQRRPQTCSYDTAPQGDGMPPTALPDTDDASAPATALERREEIAAVRAAIASLPDEAREILVLRDMNDCSYEQIAAMLSIPTGTVKSRLARARKRLGALLTAGNLFPAPPSKAEKEGRGAQ